MSSCANKLVITLAISGYYDLCQLRLLLDKVQSQWHRSCAAKASEILAAPKCVGNNKNQEKL